MNIFEQYIENIKVIPIFDEHETLKSYVQTRDKVAFDFLVSKYLGYVVSIAKVYNKTWPNFDIMDLIQEGNIGLMSGIKNYRLSKKVKLKTYITYWIKYSIYDYIRWNQSSIKIPKSNKFRKIFDNLSKERQKLISEGLPVTNEELAKNIGVVESDIENIKDVLTPDYFTDITKIDKTIQDNSTPEEWVLKKEYNETIQKKLIRFYKALSLKERIILRYKMLSNIPNTQEDYANILQTTQQNVSRIEQNVKRRLRENFTKEDIKGILDNA